MTFLAPFAGMIRIRFDGKGGRAHSQPRLALVAGSRFGLAARIVTGPWTPVSITHASR
ncbi:hypothetical protein I553_1885 [Mycobacterium xenopi 4042]|uniref:Uncharacterized protein n=1 Tax=Mycobacterium xenopi 4042 TaxID=1299334 RepID=X8DJ93_MYCXE|nr:hypothetical protein I553_1885 [Mycobacterium xenopi 4042]